MHPPVPANQQVPGYDYPAGQQQQQQQQGYDPSQIPVIGGLFPAPGPVAAPTSDTPVNTDARDAYVQKLADAHGGLVGQPSPQIHTRTAEEIKAAQQADPKDTATSEKTGYDTYTFGDGSKLTVSPDFHVPDGGWQPSTQANQAAAAANKTHPDITDKTTGNTYTWDDASGQYKPAPGVPQAARPQDGQTRQAVESGRNVTQTYDAASNSWRTTSVGDNATPGSPVEGNTRTGVDAQGHKITQTYSDGSWIQTDIQGVPKEGATRTGVDAQGRPITQTYSDGSWMTTSMGGIPQNGDSRTAVDNQGRQITQTYSDGSWIQTAISGIPQNGQTRQTINASGQPVTQTYSDGTWINTAMPGAAQEGDTRENIQGSRKVQQTFQNGGWQTTGDLGPSTPQPPTVLNTGTGNTYTAYDPNTGKVTTQANPNAADPGVQTMLLNQQAQAKHNELMQWQQQQVSSGALSADQAANAASKQFDDWWSQNVEPMKASLVTQQATQQADLQYKQAQTAYEQFLPGYDTAQIANTAANNAQQNALSLMGHLVPSNAPQILQGAMYKNAAGAPQIDASKAMQAGMFSVPNLQEIGRIGAAQALAHISPTAQAQLNTPGPLGQPAAPGGFDISSMLNQGRYNVFGTPPTGAGPAPGGASTGVGAPAGAGAPAGPTPQQLAAQNAAGQQITNLGGFSGPMPAQVAPIPQTYGPLTSSSWWGQYQPAS